MSSTPHAGPTRRGLFGAAAALALAAPGIGRAGAQTAWRARRPIRVLVPFAPGGSTDILARLITQKVGTGLGQPLVVENRPGGNGVVATQALLTAPADGHTLIMGTADTHTVLPFANPRLPYKLDEIRAGGRRRLHRVRPGGALGPGGHQRRRARDPGQTRLAAAHLRVLRHRFHLPRGGRDVQVDHRRGDGPRALPGRRARRPGGGRRRGGRGPDPDRPGARAARAAADARRRHAAALRPGAGTADADGGGRAAGGGRLDRHAGRPAHAARGRGQRQHRRFRGAGHARDAGTPCAPAGSPR